MAIQMTPEERIAAEQSLAEYSGSDKVVSSIELAEHYAAFNIPTKRHMTGIPKLDTAIEGMEPGEVVIITGPTGSGKTFLSDTIVRNLRTQKVFSLFFTFEVRSEKFVMWHKDPESVVFLPSEHRGQDLEWIRQRIWEAKLKYGCEVAVIDHLHYVIPMDKKDNVSLVIGNAMRFIKKEIALDLNMVVILLAHITKISDDKEPSLNDLRDSSLIGQEADTVLIVWRRFDVDDEGNPLDTMHDGLATIKVDKARRTGAMREKIKVKRDGMKLIESLNEPEAKKHERRKRTSIDDAFRSGASPSWMD
jgi:replicative DNA helicase